jgi:hypothetical protein
MKLPRLNAKQSPAAVMHGGRAFASITRGSAASLEAAG